MRKIIAAGLLAGVLWSGSAAAFKLDLNTPVFDPVPGWEEIELPRVKLIFVRRAFKPDEASDDFACGVFAGEGRTAADREYALTTESMLDNLRVLINKYGFDECDSLYYAIAREFPQPGDEPVYAIIREIALGRKGLRAIKDGLGLDEFNMLVTNFPRSPRVKRMPQ